MAIQGIGDRAVRELFDIYEAAFASDPSINRLPLAHRAQRR